MKSFAAAFVLSNLALLITAQGTQFITGPCTTDTDCASACCGFNSGLCAGPVIAQTRDGGCGHGDTTPNNNAALALGSTVAASGVPAAAAAAATTSSSSSSANDAAGDQDLGNGRGLQFITGVCASDADCASQCCASGLCSAVAVAAAKGGCGFLAAGSSASTAAAAAPPAAVAEGDTAGDENVGNGEGKQFITGKCDSDADCASACCASGLCSAVAVAAAKGGCGFVVRKREFWAEGMDRGFCIVRLVSVIYAGKVN